MKITKRDRNQLSCEKVDHQALYCNEQGLEYQNGVTSRTTSASSICLQVMTLGAQMRAFAHKHSDIETTGYVISGNLEIWYGNKLEKLLRIDSCCYSYIPPDVPHLVANPSHNTSCTVAVAHSASVPDFGLELLPDLDFRFAQMHPHYALVETLKQAVGA